jgi:hypothetical protein
MFHFQSLETFERKGHVKERLAHMIFAEMEKKAQRGYDMFASMDYIGMKPVPFRCAHSQCSISLQAASASSILYDLA